MDTLDRYEILGELGRGETSIVYDARDLLTDDPVALKLIESSLWAAPTSAAERLRFLTEAMREWRLTHPNIVRVYDAGYSDGRFYIAMERLEGRTLRQVLDESPLPGVQRSLRMAEDLASGLAHAHERGVLHRYLTPSNIFVFADDRAKITDFGMAPFRDTPLASSNHAVWLSYMSPEEIRCDATIDERRDIFSLGVVLYEMLTGERPFGGDSPDEIMRNVLEVQPPLPSQVNADVPPMVDLLAWSMLAKRPFFRASSAETVARRLRELREELDGLAAHARDEEVSAETTDERASGDRLVLTLDHQGDGPSAEIFVHALRELGEEEVDGLLAAHARDEGVAAAETTDERASGDRNVVLTLDHQGDEGTPSAEIFVYPFRELREVTDGALAAHAGDQEVSAAAETTDERASGDRNVAPMPGDRGDDRAPSAGIFVHPLRELREEEGDGVFAAHAGDQEVSAAAETTDERASGDRDVALTLGHQGDEGTPRAEIFVHPLRELREEEGDGVFAARVRDEEASAAAETTDERASSDRDVPLTLDHRGDEDTPSAEISVHRLEEVREEVDGALAAHAGDEAVSAAAETTDERASGDVAPVPGDRGEDRAPTAEIFVYPLHELSEEVDGPLTEPARDDGMSAAAETTDARASADATLMPGHRGEARAPTAEIFAYPLRELREVDGALAEHARDEGVSAAAETTDERASGDAALMAVHRGATKRRLQSYALTVLILAATGSAFLWQWRESLDSGEADTATPSKEPAIASTFGPVIPEESRLAASEPEPKPAASEPEPKPAASEPEPEQAASEPEPNQAASEPEPKQTASELELRPVTSEPEPKETASVPEPKHAAPEPQPKKAALEQQPKERVSKALVRKPSRSVVASGSAPARGTEPPAVALAPEPAPAKLPPLVKSAKVVFDVSPWGEIYVDGKRHGTTPPLNTIDLPPGSHRIEVRNPTQPPYIVHEMLEPGDVRPIQYRFE